MPPRRPRVYGQDLDVPMETYPSARDSWLLISPLRPASRLFPPSSFVPRRTLTQRMRWRKKKKSPPAAYISANPAFSL